METCKYCTREIVEDIPSNAASAGCGGMGCGHMKVYGLFNEDCRQVIVREDIIYNENLIS